MLLPSSRHMSTAKVYARGVNARRQYAYLIDHSPKDKAESQVQHEWMGTATSCDAGVDELIESLRQLPPHAIHRHLSNGFARLLVLLTPQLAHHATDRTLSDNLLKHAGRGLPHQLDVISAVVDGLPKTPNRESGVSFLLQTVTGISSPWTNGVAQNDAQHPGFIDFHLSNNDVHGACDVRLPLAQTTFSTGKTSTLVHSQYVRDGSAQKLRLGMRKDLEWQRVDISKKGDAQIVANLAVLTPFRFVKECMGNIVRSLSDGEHESKLDEKTASAELEQTISNYFTIKAIQPQSIGVWALIAPPHSLLHDAYSSPSALDNIASISAMTTSQIQKRWACTEMDDRQKLSDSVGTILRNGGRLCRVLSGGGGWGKKAGLLSLDPDVRYSTRKLRGDDGWAFDFDGRDLQANEGSDKLDMFLGQIVKPGERIMFLTPEDSNYTATSFNHSGGNITFGSVHLSDDETLITGTSGQHETRKQNNIEVFPGLFGAVSRLGLSLKFETAIQGVAESKFDVPLSTIAFERGTVDGFEQ